RHRLLVLAAFARDLGRLLVASLLGDPFEQPVARDLEVLGRIGVAGIPAGLFATGEVEDTFQQRAGDSAGLTDDRGRSAVASSRCCIRSACLSVTSLCCRSSSLISVSS